MRAELAGFSPIVLEDVVLSIGQKARIDLHLKVATVQETITVTGETPLVDTSSSDLSGRIDQAQIEQLPVNGRNWMNFAAMAPGVKSEDRRQPANVRPRHSRMSKVSLDGGNVQNLSTVAVDIEVSKEIIGEFEVITNRFDAVMGHAGTTIINAVTKAGTDNFRGATFFYCRDDSLNAKDFFTNRVEPYQNRQFGGVFGGPIVRGRTHFLAATSARKSRRRCRPTPASPPRRPGGQQRQTQSVFRPDRSRHHAEPSAQPASLNRYTLEQPYAGVGGLVTASGSSNARLRDQTAATSASTPCSATASSISSASRI